jgi:hypothetical protein
MQVPEMDSYQMATLPFQPSQKSMAEFVNHTLGILLTLAFLSGAFVGPSPASPGSTKKELEKELEMAHFHQSVLEEDKAQLEDCVAFLLQKEEDQPAQRSAILDETIIDLLHTSSKNARQILAAIKPAFPVVEKGEINSRLYTMMKKGLTKFKRVNGDKAPLWSLA